jgi:formamidopyrimidine-DNA glycosylase
VRLDFTCNGSLAFTMIGRVGLAQDAADFVTAENLGPDAVDGRFDFGSAIRGRKCDVKSVLMDQQIIAGIGNIYSDKILFQARINPAQRIGKLATSQLKRLYLDT